MLSDFEILKVRTSAYKFCRDTIQSITTSVRVEK